MAPRIKWLGKRRRLPSYGYHASSGSLFYLLGTTVLGISALNADINLLMILFSLCVGGILISAFSSGFVLRRITVSRNVPDVVFAGQSFRIQYTVTCHRRWVAARGLHIVDVLAPAGPLAHPEVYLPIIRPGETVVVSVPCICPRRHRIRLEQIAVATRFPFGLLTKFVTLSQENEIIVFPALGRLVGDLNLGSRWSEASSGDGVSAPMTGDEEYYGVREYRVGDNPRRIHWRRSARTGQLMVREMSRTRSEQLWCVIHTGVDSLARGQADALEEAIQATATVLCDRLEKGAKVGLLCAGEPLLVLPPGGGRANRPRLLRELAMLETKANPDMAVAVRRLSTPPRWRAPCLLFAAARSDDVEQTGWALSRLLGSVTVLVPGEPAFGKLFGQSADRRVKPHSHVARAGDGKRDSFRTGAG